MLFFKSLVHTHNRQNKDGSVSVVKQYSDTRHKAGTPVYFKPENGKSYRGGTVVSAGSTNYKVEGKRNNAGIKEVHVIPKHLVLSHAEYEAQKTKTSSGSETRETVSTSKRVISVKEGQRRKEVGTKRLGMTDDQVIANPQIQSMIARGVGKLAMGTHLVQDKTAVAKDGFIQANDPEYADSLTEYTMAMLNSLHHEAETASDDDIEQFKRHLNGEIQSSRIYWTISKAGKNAAMHFMNERIKKLKEEELVDISDIENPDNESGASQRRSMSSALSTPANQEKDLQGTAENGIERSLSKLPAFDAEMLRLKFGLGNHDAHTNDQIAEILNKDGSKYQDKYKWDRNYVGAVTLEAVTKLRSVAGVDELREFLKSLKEHLTLIKAEIHQKTICVDLAKSHNKGYTDKNGRVVSPFDDSRIHHPIDYHANLTEDVEHNIQRGMNAMNLVIQKHVDVRNAMYREGIGPVSFYWGEKGDPDKKFKGGSGISHIIARRDWEARHLPEYKDQSGIDVAHDLVEVIARGEKVREWGPEGGQRMELTFNGHTAVLSHYRQGEQDAWLLTGWKNKIAPGETGGVYDPASSTRTGTTRFHSDAVAGAADKKLSKSDSNCKIKSFPLMGVVFLNSLRKVVP